MSGNDPSLLIFTNDECKFLSQLDSLEFDVWKPDAPESVDRKKLLEKAVYFLDSLIACVVIEVEKDKAKEESETLLEAESSDREKDLNAIRQQLYEKYTERFHKLIDPKIYLLLGHFQLLLNRFDDALSAYLKYESICPEAAAKNCSFLYGLGLCCFRFNAFNRTCKLFHQILYLQPWFPKAKEIHIRLGYIYKIKNNFELSLKHFRRAIVDSTPATFSRVEIRFHLAHLFELCGKTKQAVVEYQQLLEADKSIIPNYIRHLCLRQLAWLHYNGSCGSKSAAENDLVIQWLQSALELDNTNGKTWYLLGRCQASMNRVQEAFAAYRSSIDKTEASADTWCSIGVLYQEQSQPMDALQAYFCAVQLDKCHVAAWANLGALYESTQQYKEALKCYRNALHADKNNELKPEFHERLSILQHIVPGLPEKLFSNSSSSSASNPNPGNQTGVQKVSKLPTVDEAWSLPIPAELTQRQMQFCLQEAAAMNEENSSRNQKHFMDLISAPSLMSILKRRSGRHTSSNSTDSQQSTSDRASEASLKRVRREGSPEVLPLTAQQKQMLQTLQVQETSLNAAQRHLLSQLQNQALKYHHYRLTHVDATKLHQSNSESEQNINSGSNRPVTLSPVPESVDLFPTGEDDLPTVVGSPGAEHLPEEDLAFLTDDLLAQLNRAETAANLDLVELALFASSDQQRPSSNTTNPDDRARRRISEDNPRDSKTPTTSSLNSVDRTAVDSVNSPMIDTERNRPQSNEPIDLYTYLTRPLSSPASITSSLKITMSAKQIIDAVRGLGRSGGPWWPSILPEGSPIPRPPAKPHPPPSSDKLHPAVPSVYLECRKDAHSHELMRYCLSQPCAIIRGLAVTLRMDLGLFSTRSLVEANPDHRIEVRTQVPQAPDVNRDSHGQTVWFCESPRTVTTISKFAAYQARSFVDAANEDKFPSFANSNSGAMQNTSDTQSRKESGELKHAFSAGSLTSSTPDSTKLANARAPSSELTVKHPARPKFIRFGTNCDLSDEKKWLPQLHELTKLPNFLRVVSAYNMLSHVGYPLLGMNTVQLYLKVPGSRTPGHQENNSFCAVNMNIGPGDCEWFAVPEQYWGAIHDLCEKNNVDYLTGSWWPDLETLHKEEIPVYRFIQRPGDLVWINTGTVHWVQAIGWCNNIAWNVGPMSARQYQLAAERYEFNRLRGVKSIVPMIHLSWQLAKNVMISDPALFELIKQTLLRSLVQSQLATDFIEKLGLPIKRHGKRPDDVAHSCNDCEVEVFNLLYVLSHDRKLVVRCLDCARRMDPSLRSFTILSEYYMRELTEIYDEFRLHSQPMTAFPSGKA